MWTDEQQQRYNTLRERQQANTLTAAEANELDALIQQLDDREAGYLAPANAHKSKEIAELTTRVERLEAENSQLRSYLHERQAFLERVKTMVAQIEAEDQEMRDRFAAFSAVPEEHTSPSRS